MKNQKITAILTVVLAFALAFAMVKIGKKKPKSKPSNSVPAVQVLKLTPKTQTASLTATAVIEANQTLSLTSEIAGKVIWISQKLSSGGVIKKGETLVKLDSRDYTLAVEQSRVLVEKAKLQIDQERARAEVAIREWEVLGDSTAAPDLVLRVQQKRVADLNLTSAISSLKKAELNLSRTKIRAPFTAFVSSKSVAVGQFVSQQTPLCRLLEKENLKAEVTLPLENLKWVNIPNFNSLEEDASTVTLTEKSNSSSSTGVVESLIGELDPQTRRARLRIAVDKAVSDKISRATPLLAGTFVTVNFAGKTVDDVFEIPREAVVSGDFAYLVTSANTLKKFKFERLWGTQNSLFIKTEDNLPINLVLTIPQGAVTGKKVLPVSANKDESKNIKIEKGGKSGK